MTAGRDQSKTTEARTRRASRKPSALNSEDPEFDAGLDASIELAFERVEVELERAMERIDNFRAEGMTTRKLSTTLSASLSRKYLRASVPAGMRLHDGRRPNRHCERIVNTRSHWHESAPQSARDGFSG